MDKEKRKQGFALNPALAAKAGKEGNIGKPKPLAQRLKISAAMKGKSNRKKHVS